MPKVNAGWHAKNRMPARATLDQRIAWHEAHAAACGCRKVPASVLAALAARRRAAKRVSAARRPTRMATNDTAFREHVSRALDWQEARASITSAVEGLSAPLRGRRLDGWPHSAWELVEHMRLAQHDILDFCVNPKYRELEWPKDYWPPSPQPPSADAWDASLQQFLADLGTLKRLALDPSIDLLARIPHGSGQTYLRELLLVIDHNAYHVGQLVALRRALGAWSR